VRTYLMFIGPWDQGGEWDDSGISGMSRWMNRIWNLVLGEYRSSGAGENVQLARMTHQTIKKVTGDIERVRFNTMVAALMEFTNYLHRVEESAAAGKDAWESSIRTLLLLLAPTVPHLAEELWQRKGYEYSVHSQAWPEWDKALVEQDEFTLVVQVNGKLRDRVTVPVSIKEDEAKNIAVKQEKARPYLEGRKVVKIIYVPGKLVNVVVK
jgi:leucyl-tRNA synthetase